MYLITGKASATPSICFRLSTYLVLRLAVDDVSCIAPGRVKIISARTFDARRWRSFDIPRASPVKSITRQTPSATPATLTRVRMGRWRMLETTRLSMRVTTIRHFAESYHWADVRLLKRFELSLGGCATAAEAKDALHRDRGRLARYAFPV